MFMRKCHTGCSLMSDGSNVMIKRLLVCLVLLAAVPACSVNPVTGKSEISFVGEATEIQMGEQNYAPMQQSQGGQYDVDPVLTEYVQGVGHKLAAVSDRPLPYEFVVLNNSVPNAWALPGGKIAINRGLLTELGSEAELAAVLGHEIVHAAARHSARQMERGMLMQGLVLATAVATSDSDYGRVAVGGASFAGQLLTLKYGRGAELEADSYGMKYMAAAGYDPQGAVSLQQTFVRLSEGQRSDWLSGLFASHPPSQERVEANIATASAMPPGGEMGVERYKEALEKTTEALPAYKAYDEGRKALADRNADLAIAKAEQAIAIFPQEAHFYALRGDARIVNEQYDMAVTNFDNAIKRRDNFFYYYLQRGRANERLGNEDGAVRDLQKSLEYLPTAPAHLTLGNIAAKRGDRAAAMKHFQVVAAGQGEIADAARASLVRLDIGQNPGAYLLTRCDPGTNNELVVSVKNNTTVPVTDVRLSVQVRDSAGALRRVDRRLTGRIGGGEVVSVPTGLGPYAAGSGCPVEITSAKLAH
jgi:beta-barrel assembly-enhancing protease